MSKLWRAGALSKKILPNRRADRMNCKTVDPNFITVFMKAEKRRPRLLFLQASLEKEA